MRKSELKQIIREEVKKALKENKYLINLTYSVPKNWFNSPSDVLKNNLSNIKKDNMISDFEIKNLNYINNDFVATIKTISNVDKSALMGYLKNHSTQIENWKLI